MSAKDSRGFDFGMDLRNYNVNLAISHDIPILSATKAGQLFAFYMLLKAKK